ncbi:hypothetical protein [Enterococcus sp. AZ072]|uniref:hypothetical protein n=1 Tax=unclassified Enterococcus TaxID=2608891 RepID=UPI003D278709
MKKMKHGFVDLEKQLIYWEANGASIYYGSFLKMNSFVSMNLKENYQESPI